MNLLDVPPGILDLVPWKPRRHVHHRQTAPCDLTPGVWSQLPESLLHSILGRLPFQSILSFRCVCRQWKALFESPSFNDLFALHRTDLHPWIFFIGSTHRSARVRAHPAHLRYDDGRDDNGFVYEGHGQFDHIYLNDSDPSIDGHDVLQLEDHGDMDDASSSDEDGDLHGGTQYGDQQDGLHDDGNKDHGDLHHPLGSDDVCDGGVNGVIHHGDQQDGIVTKNQWYPYNVGGHAVNHWYPFLDADDVVHVKKKRKREIGELFLIFDCKSESWHRAIAIAPGFKSPPENFLCRYNVCFLQEQVLVVTTHSHNRIFVFNPASPLGKELPPCVCTKEVEGVVLAERTSGMSSKITSLASVLKDKRATEQLGCDTILKDLVVVVIGDTGLGNNVVESFDFVTGAWHVCGYMELFEDEPIVTQMRMVYCKGSIYVMSVCRMLIINNYLAGQKFEWTSWDFPTLPNENEDEQHVQMVETRLLATKDSVLLVGVTETSPVYGGSTYEVLDWDVGIWKFCPHVPQDACWQFVAYTPKGILDGFYGDADADACRIDALAHGDLVFFHVPETQRFVIYDMTQKLWKLSAKCKHFLQSLSFVWEPLLRK